MGYMGNPWKFPVNGGYSRENHRNIGDFMGKSLINGGLTAIGNRL
jgi:hypothetical protein